MNCTCHLICMKLSCVFSPKILYSDRINRPSFPQSCLGITPHSVPHKMVFINTIFQNYINVNGKYLTWSWCSKITFSQMLPKSQKQNTLITRAVFQRPVKKSCVSSVLVCAELFFFLLDCCHLHQPIHIRTYYVCICISVHSSTLTLASALMEMSLGLCLEHE